MQIGFSGLGRDLHLKRCPTEENGWIRADDHG
jgi:hypothetical protein